MKGGEISMPANTTLWSEVIVGSFQNLWSRFLLFVPQLVLAIVIFLIGWIIALALEQVIARVLKMAKLNEGLERAGVNDVFKKAEVPLDGSKFVAALVRWFLVLVFLFAAADMLGLSALTAFLEQVLLYIPNIIVAALILLVAGVASDWLDRLVGGAVKASGFGYGKLAGGVARWSVFVFGAIAALQQLGIATQILQTFITGVIAMIALAGGVAFGLGGKDAAAEVLNKFRERMER